MAGSENNRLTDGCKDIFSVLKAPANKGAMGELIVCVDLMSRGYMVFRAVHPNSPYDLIAIAGDRLFRIEVKVGQLSSNGRRKRKYRKYLRNNRVVDDYDVIASVLSENEVTYTHSALHLDAADVVGDDDLSFYC